MRILHTMLRVGDLDKSIDFYVNRLGMNLLRKKDYPHGKFTLAFVGYGSEKENSVIERSFPFGSFLLFIVLFAGLVKNPKVPYFIRYNACQALLIDIALIIISYLLRIFPIVELGSIIFIFTLCIFIYSIFQCIYGVEPEIPLISKSVRMQI